MKPKSWTDAVIASTGGEDEKMHKIVAEVDRFFKSVHADVEDWKFSMEDYGDGTRIFVRFQIHINKSGDAAKLAGSKERASTPGRRGAPGEGVPTLAIEAGPDELGARGGAHEPEATGAARRADSDIASFVDLWRHRRESNVGAEYHKEGSPFVDASSDEDNGRRSVGGPSLDVATEHADEEQNVPRRRT
jgi:hypothetical protein